MSSRSSGSGALVGEARKAQAVLGAQRTSAHERAPSPKPTTPGPPRGTVIVGMRGLTTSVGSAPSSPHAPALPPPVSPTDPNDQRSSNPLSLVGMARMKPSPANSPPPSPKHKQPELPTLVIPAQTSSPSTSPRSSGNPTFSADAPQTPGLRSSNSNTSPRQLGTSQPFGSAIIGSRPPSPRGPQPKLASGLAAMVVPAPPPATNFSVVDASGMPVRSLSQSSPSVSVTGSPSPAGGALYGPAPRFGTPDFSSSGEHTPSPGGTPTKGSGSQRKSPTGSTNMGRQGGTEQLRELLLEPQLRVVSALVDVLDSSDKDAGLQEELNEVALTFVHFFEGHNTIMRLLRHIIVKEIRNTLDHTTLFRSNSLSTKMMTAYSRISGAKYMTILHAPIEALMRADCAQMELDPVKLKPGQTAEGNWARLEQHLIAFMKVIVSSSHLMPPYAFCVPQSDARNRSITHSLLALRGFVEVCNILCEETAKRFPDSRLTSIGGFLFLRFLCPAIVSPESFELANASEITPDVRRALILLSKVLQNLANGVKKISGKEAFMRVSEGFLVSQIPQMFAWFEQIVTLPRPAARFSEDARGHQKDSALYVLQPLLSRNIHKIGRQLLSNDKCQSVAAFATSAFMKGYLFKKGESKNTAWRKRWCILKDDFLYYFRTPNDTNPAGVVPLSGSTLQLSGPHEAGDKYVFEIVSSHRVYWMKAKTGEELDEWMKHIQKLIEQKRISVRNDWKPANSSGQTLLERRGWVVKRGNKIKTWKKRWCILKDQYLLYFKSPDDAVPKGEIKLDDCSVRAADAKAVDPPGICFLIETRERTWWMLAQDGDDMQLWMEAVRQAKARFQQRTMEIGQEIDAGEGGQLHREQIDRLISKMKDPSTGLALKDRTVYLKTFPGCFQGNHFVDWIVKNVSMSRKEGYLIGQQLLKGGEIHHIEHALQFMDGPKFYQFKSTDSMINSKKEGVLWRASKDRKKWKRWWVVLKGSYLYFFRNSQKNAENDKKSRVLPLQGTTIYISERTTGDKGFSFDIVTRQRIYFMKSEDEQDMQTWVQLFTEARELLGSEEHGAQGLQKRGWMSKQGGKMRVWQKRMFHMRGNMLYYYKNPQDADPAGVIPLSNCTVEPVKVENKNFVFQVTTRYRNYYLSVETQQEFDDWREIIGNAKQLSDEASATEDMKMFLRLTEALSAFEQAKT